MDGRTGRMSSTATMGRTSWPLLGCRAALRLDTYQVDCQGEDNVDSKDGKEG